MQKKCNKCDSPVYDDEPDCPHCGAPYEVIRKDNSASKKLIWMFFLFVLFYGAKAIIVDAR